MNDWFIECTVALRGVQVEDTLVAWNEWLRWIAFAWALIVKTDSEHLEFEYKENV